MTCPIAPSGAGERAGKYDDDRRPWNVMKADVKTNPKTSLELANADDDDD